MTDNTVAGYRTVRTLAESERRRLLLVHSLHPELAQGSSTARSGMRCIKQFHEGVSVAQILAEVVCHARSNGEHVVRIDDLAASLDDAPLLILNWIGSDTLRRLLRERGSLRPGEAITIIAPLISALGRAHHAGVAIGDVSVDSVAFDENGCPYFTEFGFAQLRATNPTPATIQLDEAFQEDRRRLAALSLGVLDAVNNNREKLRTVREFGEWLGDDSNTQAHDWAQEVERRLFSIGPPEPLRFSSEVVGAGESPSTISRPITADGSRGGDTAAGAGAPSSEARSLLALPPWLDGQLAETARELRRRSVQFVGTIVTWCRPVRARQWAIAVGGLVCVVAAASILAIEAAAEGDETLAASPVLAKTIDDEAIPTTEEVQLPRLPPEAEQALPLLIDARNRCLRDLSVVCLEEVSPVGTPAYADDIALIDAVLAGGELPSVMLFDAATAVETQRLGDSAVFEIGAAETSKPASVLLVKGEAGWRIRSYSLPD
ncbi:hypothetical protein [Salinibacterium sp. M195]|uniref:hypothetical protein n=1 Tax=Salinibacterium sp. M195 TaxID=2583374 RepID=UPI001C6280B2|nr:hypothetical protein [Salinibacterium sp. M195]QYH36053.1 hypothetical protein FFT87_08865 [Salinibacterium sp. M195]